MPIALPLAGAVRSRRTVPTRRLLPMLFVAIAAAYIAARPAAAQPGDGIPKQITGREISDYAERLGLSPLQVAGIEPIHDAYKSDFARLRETVIVPWQQRQQRMNMGGPSVTRDQVTELFEDQAKVMTRIAALDARFFNQLAPLLTPDQAAALPRIRLVRERTRANSSGMLMAFGGVPTDLSAIASARQLDLDEEAAIRLDSELIPYERRLTSSLKELDAESRTMIIRIIDIFDEAGMLGMSQEEMLADPAAMAEMMQLAQKAFAEAGQEAQDVARDLHTWNVSVARRLMNSLPPLAAIQFREAYVMRQAEGALGLVVAAPSGTWASSLGVRDLDEDTRGVLEAQLRSALSLENNTIFDTVEAFALARTQIQPGMINNTAFQDLAEEVRKDAEAMQQRRGRVEQEVVSILGEDWRTRIGPDPESGDGFSVSPSGVVIVERGTAAEQAAEQARVASFVDALTPTRISTRAAGVLATRLDLDDAQREMLDFMHSDYVESFRSLPEVDAVRAARRDRYTQDDGDSLRQRSLALKSARSRAIAAIAALDETFFDTVTAAFGGSDERDATVDRERLMRRIARATTGGTRGLTQRGGGDQGSVDVVELIRASALSSADQRFAEVALSDHLVGIAEAAEAMHDARVEVDLATAEWQIRLADTSGLNDDPLAFQALYTEVMGPSSERLEACLGDVADLNTLGLDLAYEAISSDARLELEQAWQRAAFPTVYIDPLCVIETLERALELTDLDGAQRDDLRLLLAEYRAEWNRLSGQLAEAVGESVNMIDWQNLDWNEIQERERTLTGLQAERTDTSIRAANRLRIILREDQLTLVGGLPDPEDERSLSLFF